MGEKILFPTSSPLAGRNDSAIGLSDASIGGSSLRIASCRLASDPGVKLSGAGGAFLRLSQSASARMLRTTLLLGDGDVLSSVEAESELEEVDAMGKDDFAGVYASISFDDSACNDSGVSSGEK